MNIEFSGEIWYWRGPAPFYFVTVPETQSKTIKGISGIVTYGWGMIPALVHIGDTEFKTALFPKDGKYVVPLKADVRKAEALETGDTIAVELEIQI